MSLPTQLLEFLRAHRDELTLSVYIEAAPADPAARRNWRVRFRQGLSDVRSSLDSALRDERDAFERCAAAVLEQLPDGAEVGGHGWACFATAGGDLLTIAMPEVAETSVTWGVGARVVPYLRSGADSDALVVWIDREHARIAHWHDGALEPKASFTAGHPAEPGTLAHAAQRVAALAAPAEPLLIGGVKEAAEQFIASLPAHLATRATTVPTLGMHSSDGAAAAAITEALREHDRSSHERRAQALREQAHVNGHAAVGIAPARSAADLGAIAELIFSERAWRQHPLEIEELVQRALAGGADVALVPAAPGAPLDGDADGVIAGLRFPLPVTP